MKYIALLIPLIILLTACGTPAQPAPPAPTATLAPTTTPSPQPTVTAPLPTPTALPLEPTEPVFESPVATQAPDSSGETESDQPVIELKRSGGFAGLEEIFLVYADGRIENDRQGTFQADPQAIETLLNNAAADGFFDLDESYLSKNTCCDRFIYQLTIRHSGQENSVITIDDADNPPAALQSTLEAVGQLISNP